MATAPIRVRRGRAVLTILTVGLVLTLASQLPAHADVISGGPGNDTLHGTSGDDTIYGYGGDDTVHAGEGNDRVYGGAGNDHLRGNPGNDVVKGDGGNDTLLGGYGDDVLRSREGVRDTVSCGPGNDIAILDWRDGLMQDHGCQDARRPTRQVVPDSVNLADPTVVDLNGRFWAYGTNGPVLGGKIPMYLADHVNGPWSYQGKAIAEIPWAKDRSAVFAPDVRHTGGDRVLLYFAATPKSYSDARKCIGVAVSTNGPGGPFQAQSGPMFCAPRRGGTIDPSYFKDPSTGRVWILYKTNHKLDDPSDPLREIWARPVTTDGLSLDGSPTHLVGRRTNIEHPQLMRKQGKYLLFVSRNRYKTYEYNTSVLYSSTLSGTYSGERAFITTSNSKAAGPGGADLVWVEENRIGWVAFFHGWEKEGGDCYVRRPMWAARIKFGADGLTPNLSEPGSGPTPSC